MSTKRKNILRNGEVKHFAKSYIYPCGLMDIIACSEPIFGPKGWEKSEDFSRKATAATSSSDQHDCPEEDVENRGRNKADEDIERSQRRARAKVRRMALANDFKYFVTLTIDPKRVDSKNAKEVIKKLNIWASNAVQRNGLQYILVPEYHKKGGIHFHGFFNDCAEVVDSGTIKIPTAKKPRRPRSKAQRSEWLSDGGKIVYNLPSWTLGFSTAFELYGEYPAAVAYVCKYIGKEKEKPAGRWYYSGGPLKEPKTVFLEVSPAELVADYGEKAFLLYPPGRQIAVVNGLNV